MPERTNPPAALEASCFAAADHFIACRGHKPAARIRTRSGRIDQAEAFAAAFGRSRAMICAVAAKGRRAHITNACRRP